MTTGGLSLTMTFVAAAERKQVLVVDDDTALLGTLGEALASDFERVETASSAASAVELLRGWTPGIILLDVVLPDGDAFQVVDAVRGRTPTPVVIAMSGVATASTAFTLARHGVDGYLQKPFELAKLRAEMERASREPRDLTLHLRSFVGKRSIRAVEQDVRRTMLEEALARVGGSRKGAARLLDVSRQVIQHMIRRLGS